MKGNNCIDVIPELGYFICRYCNEDWVMHDSITNFVDLTYILEGSATYIVNGEIFKAEKGDLICIPFGSRRHAEIDPEQPMVCYAANFDLYDRNGKEIDLPFPIHSKVGLQQELMMLYQELNIHWVQKKPGYQMKVRSIFLDILYHYYQKLYFKEQFENKDPRIQNVIRFIYNNYRNSIEVDDLALLAGLNPAYFGLIFKKSTGFSVKEFINRVRIDNAENMLSSGQFKIKEVAANCGFDDYYYFSKVFKNIKGYPPSKVVLHIYGL